MTFKDKIFNKKVNEQQIEEKFDVVIIGGGQTGLILARQLIKKEIKTLVIDKDKLGIKTSLDLKNFTKLIKRIKSKNQDPRIMINTFPQRLEYISKEQNQELINPLISNSFFKFIKGNIENIDEYELTINDKKYGFRKLVFATGSYFVEPTNYPNLKKEMYFNLNEISRIKEYYENIAIYGTNIEALELAYAFALLGSNVYIFDENVNPFNNFDDDLESILKTDFMTDKIIWCLESKIINHIKSSDKAIRIIYSTQGKEKYIEVDKIFVTGNKVSETRNLKTKYDLKLNSNNSIIIDSNFRVKNNPTYYAIGDVNGIRFIPDFANLQAVSLSRIITGQKVSKFNLYNVGFSIDIEPQICFYGMNKQDLDYHDIKFNEFIYDFNYELNSKLFAHKSKLKVYTNEKHEILGVFLYGHKVKELLSIFILAANNKIKFHKLAYLSFLFYSKSEFIRDAAIDYELEFVGLSKKIKKITNTKEGRK
ncbi:FAD-dependent oxidoreductase [Mesomycoplasma moatsii]|uniref:FAD-dependent oxidoreductase n=1 Tax=Mesomycoplasma moatsii TaxID=171287 RepID=UPI0003B7879B